MAPRGSWFPDRSPGKLCALAVSAMLSILVTFVPQVACSVLHLWIILFITKDGSSTPSVHDIVLNTFGPAFTATKEVLDSGWDRAQYLES